MSRHASLADTDRARHIAGFGTAAALDLVPGLRTPDGVRKASELEARCFARSAVLEALRLRMDALRTATLRRRRRPS